MGKYYGNLNRMCDVKRKLPTGLISPNLQTKKEKKEKKKHKNKSNGRTTKGLRSHIDKFIRQNSLNQHQYVYCNEAYRRSKSRDPRYMPGDLFTFISH